MAVILACGWECRIAAGGAAPVPDQRHWDAVVGTPTIDTAIKRSGAASLRLNPAGASQNAQKILAQNVVPGRIYVYFASLPTGQSSLFRHVNANGNLNID